MDVAVLESHTRMNSISSKSDDIELLEEIQTATPPGSQNDKEVRDKEKEMEKREREAKKEMEKLQREKQKIEKEKLRLEKKLKQEQEKELKRKRLEEEKELKRKRLEEEKESKRKRLEQEKEVRKKKIEEERLEKKRKLEQQRELKKRKLEEERETKKRRIEEEREFKKRKIEEEKELKKSKLDEEKKKLEALQTRIMSFFTIQKKSSPKKPEVTTMKGAGSSDYKDVFLPFYVKQNCQLMPSGTLSYTELGDSKKSYDTVQSAGLVRDWLRTPRFKAAQDTRMSAKQVVALLNQDASDESEVTKALNNIPLQYIQFYENVKPAYCGTFSKTATIPVENPLARVADVNYDYDSDWDAEDDAGEDVDDVEDEDDEDEGPEDEGSDMEGFLEDNNAKASRKLFMGSLTPEVKINYPGSTDFCGMEMQLLLPEVVLPLDPNQDYWGKKDTQKREIKSQGANMPVSTEVAEIAVSGANITGVLQVRKKPKTVIKEKKELKSFATTVLEFNDFTLATLVDILKKKFPNYTKLIIKNTLEHIAEKQGSKQSEKKWVVKKGLEF